MFNKIIKYKFWVSGGIIFILGAWYMGTMLRFSGIVNTEKVSGSLFNRAKQYYLDGAYKKAVNLYEKILILEPKNTNAILDLAIICDDYLNVDDKAIELYKRYVELEPSSGKKALIEGWIKETANESLGLQNNLEDPEAKKISQLEKDNELLKEEVKNISGKLYTIQDDHGKEIKKLQSENERLASELASARIRIGKLTTELSDSLDSKSELLQELAEAIKKEQVIKARLKASVGRNMKKDMPSVVKKKEKK